MACHLFDTKPLSKAGFLLIGNLGLYFSGIQITIQQFSYKKINLKMSSVKDSHLSASVS